MLDITWTPTVGDYVREVSGKTAHHALFGKRNYGANGLFYLLPDHGGLT